MKEFGGKVAVITGAGSGIGRALALNLAARGSELALSDVDEVRVAETAAQCEKIGATARPTSSTFPTAPPSPRTPSRCARTSAG